MVRSGRIETPSSTSRRSTSARIAGGSCRLASQTRAGEAGSGPSSSACASWIPTSSYAVARGARPSPRGPRSGDPRRPQRGGACGVRRATNVAVRPVSGSRSVSPSIPPARARPAGGAPASSGSAAGRRRDVVDEGHPRAAERAVADHDPGVRTPRLRPEPLADRGEPLGAKAGFLGTRGRAGLHRGAERPERRLERAASASPTCGGDASLPTGIRRGPGDARPPRGGGESEERRGGEPGREG